MPYVIPYYVGCQWLLVYIFFQICVALKKKQLQLYSVTEDRLNHIRDVSISEPAVALVSKSQT